MTRYFAYFLLAIIIPILSCSCSGDNREEKAAELGRKDAGELIALYHATKKDDIKIHGLLLEVREKERKLTNAGMEKAARNYIDAFKQTVWEQDSLLYKSVFELQK